MGGGGGWMEGEGSEGMGRERRIGTNGWEERE